MPRIPQALRPARKAQVGTTYVSGQIDDPNLQKPELNAEAGSSQPIVIREIVPELISPYQRLVTYTRMQTDAAVDVSLRVLKTPVLAAEFYIDPYDDQAINQEIAEFVGANLFDGMSSPFLTTLEDLLHFYEDGYSILEKVYELREWTPRGKGRNTKQYTMLKKLGVRPPSTVQSIKYDDNGGPLQVTQGALRASGEAENVDLPINKIMIFTFSRQGGDLTGKSILRTAYAHWYYKTHLYKIDAIQKERNSLGVPAGTIGPAATKEDKDALRTMLKNLRSNEESFMILTPNIDVEFKEVHGNLVNVLESAGHHNTMILLNVMAEFMALGLQGTSGARATGATQADMFMKSTRHVANYVADTYNMYLVPELVVWNYNTKSFPKVNVRNVGETRDLQMLGSALANLFAQGGLTPDIQTEDWIRAVFDMPRKNPSEYVQPVIAPATSDAFPPKDTATTNGGTQKGNVSIKGNNSGQGNVGKPINAPQ